MAAMSARPGRLHVPSPRPRFLSGRDIAALLEAIAAPPPLDILDLGCGPGRDLRAFADLGHRPVGLDGAAPFVAMAMAYSGCPVWRQDFLALDLPAGRFDGIFANASLFHVPRADLPRVLAELRAALIAPESAPLRPAWAPR